MTSDGFFILLILNMFCKIVYNDFDFDSNNLHRSISDHMTIIIITLC